MAAGYLCLRLPLHSLAGGVCTKQGYREFRWIAPMLIVLDLYFGGQHAAKLVRTLAR